MESKNSLSKSIIAEALPGGATFEMVFVEGGSFLMGSEDEEAHGDEKPVHKVELDGFYIGKFPVTQALWKAVMGDKNNPSRFKDDNRPVESVFWNDAQAFIKKLNELTGKAYRLPTEAEWEYAARGGQGSRGYKYAGSNKLREVGWYDAVSHRQTNVVGRKYPNELGIHDMSGNVWEWCQDWFSDSYYAECNKQGTVVNPQGPAGGTYRVLRGGAWNGGPLDCRCTVRPYTPGYRGNSLGFRLVLPSQSVG